VIGLSALMSIVEFMQQNEDRIINFDGNLDDGNLTIIGDDGLEFYYFEDGVITGLKKQK
jgi:hypothetical protein